MLGQTLLSPVFLFVLMPLSSLAGGGAGFTGITEVASSSDGASDIQLEASPMGELQTAHYTKGLNTHMRDWGLMTAPKAVGQAWGPSSIRDSVPWVRDELLAQRKQNRMFYIGMTPDNRRKMYATILSGSGHEAPYVAFVSTPKIWTSLSQKMQLHTFAKVPTHQSGDLQEAMAPTFNAVKLNDVAARALPINSQGKFDALLGLRPYHV